MKYYAHSLEGAPPEEWQSLEAHLKATAKLARKFAQPFGAGDWAYLAGLWHDLGKYSSEFQKKLFDANGVETHIETKPGKVIHSEAGGHLAQKSFDGGLDRVFAWLIMGHHAGLADYQSDKTGGRALSPKMMNPDESQQILNSVPEKIKNQPEPLPPPMLQENTPADISFLIRMLFSCVVDADFLDTEKFMNRDKAELRECRYPPLSELLPQFELYMQNMCNGAKSTKVNRIRAKVLKNCQERASMEPGVFSLTVPTGGGKTLASLAFALKHAAKWGRHRIIYVIPYTNIIEQTAEVFRSIPGFEYAVLEHHSNVYDDDESLESMRRRLAAENWDTPIVVTTAVQFFESLYASKTSRCRKLHNIVGSVVIFDEAQCLPPGYLRPAVFSIRELSQYYDVTPVLCTATQPVLTQTEQFDFMFKEGFGDVTEIVDDPNGLACDLERVVLKNHDDLNPVSNLGVLEALKEEDQSVLCIVNRKQDCRELARELPDDRTFHLSTNMCARHRLLVLNKIRETLAKGKQVFVVSTSLVEAGVDLDFPVVYRALAGLDSIAQAAGRCNREGSLASGRTVVFVPECQPDYVAMSASLAREFLGVNDIDKVFLPDTFNRYFKERFFQLGTNALDEKGILKLLGGNLDFYFRSASESFKLIDDSWQLPVIVPYGEAPALLDELLDWDARTLFRKLQHYTINVAQRVVWRMLDEGYVHALSEYPGTYYLQATAAYTDRYGFIPPDQVDNYDSEATII